MSEAPSICQRPISEKKGKRQGQDSRTLTRAEGIKASGSHLNAQIGGGGLVVGSLLVLPDHF